ncbi:polyprenyl synthetase family protein [Streptomyces sp. BE303]|uniref:polyprenyl synthetase family protein n=1 Tax=Streptomyces sp. BE303 TaxID=3002528 RepID=UPI002E778E21|nr:polyprenyl synthetase family protein [Streptomyces sp. BE303]MED7953697.1 polyprenyl synthetase family protein [Streptomyces sp. BE303]
MSTAAGPTAVGAPLVERVLARYRERTVAELLRHIPEQSPPYLYELTADYPARPCKGLRAALCLVTCTAFGGSAERALNPAVTVELFHNAFLIHDDIQDGSELRRGSPTLPARYGVEVALNVGNATNLLGLRRVMANRRALGGELAWRLFEETELMCRQSLEGQALEIGWIRDNVCDLTATDYYRMCLKKTSWYTFLYPCRSGLLVAEGASTDASRLDRFGWYLGAAFQIQDDVLNLVGTAEEYGKEIAGDLWEGKRTLMLIHLLERATPAERARVVRYLSSTRAQRGPDAADDVHWLLDRMAAYDCVAGAQEAAAGLVAAAEREIEGIVADLPEPAGEDADAVERTVEAREFLLALPGFVVARGR